MTATPLRGWYIRYLAHLGAWVSWNFKSRSILTLTNGYRPFQHEFAPRWFVQLGEFHRWISRRTVRSRLAVHVLGHVSTTTIINHYVPTNIFLKRQTNNLKHKKIHCLSRARVTHTTLHARSPDSIGPEKKTVHHPRSTLYSLYNNTGDKFATVMQIYGLKCFFLFFFFFTHFFFDYYTASFVRIFSPKHTHTHTHKRVQCIRTVPILRHG